MINYEQALDRVRARIAEFDAPEDDAWIVYQQHTVEKPFGWVFFWGSDMYAKTGDFAYAVGGNAPYIVNRHSGAVVETGTALPTEVYVQRYETSLKYDAIGDRLMSATSCRSPTSVSSSLDEDENRLLFCIPHLASHEFFRSP